MLINSISDKDLIEGFLRKDPFMHLYGIGDLDDFFWPNTQWFGIYDKNSIVSILLLYQDIQYPVLLALNSDPQIFDQDIISELAGLLPKRFYGHLTGDFQKALDPFYDIRSNGNHIKMGLSVSSGILNTKTEEVFRLTEKDEPDINDLFEISYPGNWFNSRMLLTGQYFGIRRDGRLISVAGVHVYSEKYRVAALGNITTHPDHRGNGYATLTTARLCQSLIKTVDHIGLNVHRYNTAAICCYQNLGFEVIGEYEEVMCRLKYDPDCLGKRSNYIQ